MAKKRTTRTKSNNAVASIRHKDKRKNIPTEELRDFVAADENAPKTMLYSRDPSLDPQLVWKGKHEQDAEDLEVPVVSIHVQDTTLPCVSLAFGQCKDHGQDGHATECGTAFQAVEHGQDAHVADARTADRTLVIRQGAYLPHWTLEGATYHVAFRLADSLPEQVVELWRLEREKIASNAQSQNRALTEHEETRLRQLYSEKVEKYLDAGHGECWLKDGCVAVVVRDALRHFDSQRYEVCAWCVMPNHVHVVVRPARGYDLPGILHSWKSFTANRINQMLGRSGTVWQPESYDHLIRDQRDFQHAVAYVLDNPRTAGLEDWPWCGMGF